VRVGTAVLVGVFVGETTGGVAVGVDVPVGVGVDATVAVDVWGTVGVAVRMVTVVTVPPLQPATSGSMRKVPATDTARRRADVRITRPSWLSLLKRRNGALVLLPIAFLPLPVVVEKVKVLVLRTQGDDLQGRSTGTSRRWV
jgi:hypothetical protein